MVVIGIRSMNFNMRPPVVGGPAHEVVLFMCLPPSESAACLRMEIYTDFTSLASLGLNDCHWIIIVLIFLVATFFHQYTMPCKFILTRHKNVMIHMLVSMLKVFVCICICTCYIYIYVCIKLPLWLY